MGATQGKKTIDQKSLARNNFEPLQFQNNTQLSQTFGKQKSQLSQIGSNKLHHNLNQKTNQKEIQSQEFALHLKPTNKNEEDDDPLTQLLNDLQKQSIDYRDDVSTVAYNLDSRINTINQHQLNNQEAYGKISTARKQHDTIPDASHIHLQENLNFTPSKRPSGVTLNSNSSVKEQSEYKYIPNNFKNKEGVAFANTSFKIKMDAGTVGIYNMGNTCFINTALQCISAVQPLTDFFIGDLYQYQINKTNPMGSGGVVTLKFADLLKQIWSGNEVKIYPVKLLKILGEHAPHLVCGQQQDAQEFLAYFLDCLHEDLNRADKKSILDSTQKDQNFNPEQKQNEQEIEEEDLHFENLSDEQQELIACESWKEHLFNNRSIIVDLFQGQLKSTVTCLKCSYISIKFDCFMYLSVPIPTNRSFLSGNPTLEECVQEFTKEEILDGENKWKCPKCKSFQKSKKKIDIWKMPSIFIIHLKRFEFNPQKRGGGKITQKVSFPLKNLNLTPYVSKLQREKPIYDLFAVANHDGYLGGGHYYAYTKHRLNQKWYYCDDDSVKVTKESSVVTKDAYILFYSKMTADEFFRQTLSEPGLWPHMVKNSQQSISTMPDMKQHQNYNYGIKSPKLTQPLIDEIQQSPLQPREMKRHVSSLANAAQQSLLTNPQQKQQLSQPRYTVSFNQPNFQSIDEYNTTPQVLYQGKVPQSYNTSMIKKEESSLSFLAGDQTPRMIDQFEINSLAGDTSMYDSRQPNRNLSNKRDQSRDNNKSQNALKQGAKMIMNNQNFSSVKMQSNSRSSLGINNPTPNQSTCNQGIAQKKRQPIVINNNNNHYFINLYMKNKEPTYY